MKSLGRGGPRQELVLDPPIRHREFVGGEDAEQLSRLNLELNLERMAPFVGMTVSRPRFYSQPLPPHGPTRPTAPAGTSGRSGSPGRRASGIGSKQRSNAPATWPRSTAGPPGCSRSSLAATRHQTEPGDLVLRTLATLADPGVHRSAEGRLPPEVGDMRGPLNEGGGTRSYTGYTFATSTIRHVPSTRPRAQLTSHPVRSSFVAAAGTGIGP